MTQLNCLSLLLVADLYLYTGVAFRGMKLAGIVSIFLGFVVVLLPSNLGEIFLRFLRFNLEQNEVA